MASITTITNYINSLLDSKNFDDYAPNGLQVQGKTELKKIVSGVSFWDKEDPRIIGMKYKRLKLLMDNEISLLGYHLPLDAHPEYGNNAQLAKRLEITIEDVMDKQGIGNYGRLAEYTSLEQLGERIEKALSRKPLLISGGDHAIRKVAWCTGGAQNWIHQAAEAGVDAYISGEISEHTVHTAREMGLHYIAAGHHATERYGAKALGEHVAAKFGLLHEFIDIDNPA